MMDEIRKIWIDLGQPSYISGFNLILIVSYLINKIIDTLSKSKREREFQDSLELLSYRVSKVEDSLKIKPNL